jgi:hypothetical protein
MGSITFVAFSMDTSVTTLLSSQDNETRHFPYDIVPQSPVLAFINVRKEQFGRGVDAQIPNVDGKSVDVLIKLMKEAQYQLKVKKEKSPKIVKYLQDEVLWPVQTSCMGDLLIAIDYLNVTNEVGMAIAKSIRQKQAFLNASLPVQPILFAMQLLKLEDVSAGSKIKIMSQVPDLIDVCWTGRLDVVKHCIKAKKNDSG